MATRLGSQLNAKVSTSSLAKAAGLKGIFLDTQQYENNIFWNCGGQAGGFASCEELLKRRGQQFMSALLERFSDITLLVSLGYAEVFVSTCLVPSSLSQSPLGGLPAFLDGVEVARAEARAAASVVDAFLASYPAQNPRAFQLYHDVIHFDWQAAMADWVPGTVTYEFPVGVVQDYSVGERRWPGAPGFTCSEVDRGKLARDLPAGFGVSLDYDSWNRGGFQVEATRFAENYRSPDQLETVVRAALAATDRYVWLWSGDLVWYDIPGSSRVPDAYVEAIRRAKGQP